MRSSRRPCALLVAFHQLLLLGDQVEDAIKVDWLMITEHTFEVRDKDSHDIATLGRQRSWMCEHILLCHPSPMRTKKNEFRHQTKKKAIDRELQNPTWLTIYYTQYIIIPLGYWSLGHFLLLILSYFLYDMPPQTPLSFFTGTHPNNWHFPCPVGILTRRLITHRNTHKQAHFMEIIYTSPTPSII